MNPISESEPSEVFLEVARKIYPRYRCAPVGTRSYNESAEWACSIDWINNPYDRFLLRREVLFHLEEQMHEDPRRSIRRFATRKEVLEEIDWCLESFLENCQELNADPRDMGSVFSYLMVRLPWRLGIKHGYVRYSPLNKALRFLEKSKAQE